MTKPPRADRAAGGESEDLVADHHARTSGFPVSTGMCPLRLANLVFALGLLRVRWSCLRRWQRLVPEQTHILRSSTLKTLQRHAVEPVPIADPQTFKIRPVRFS